ncbi:ArsR/SmtB family transcription factor [[Clostridium] dakarense]|uniref:ArsR/SmtB family transcription factor n=1 Tax=Faecalimicrobium dakarense TaxID=1301100 RepID=UPI0004B8A6DB|nr:ArsR family transcriptional regulator [[Clostridium] dakarense]
MDYLKTIKALSNKTRFNILQWLKDPKSNFEQFGWQPHNDDPDSSNFVCVGYIYKKAGQSQSTVSEHLSVLEKTGLLRSVKIGQWTLYARNEEIINDFKVYINENL